jgi:hypothetical protein
MPAPGRRASALPRGALAFGSDRPSNPGAEPGGGDVIPTAHAAWDLALYRLAGIARVFDSL